MMILLEPLQEYAWLVLIGIGATVCWMLYMLFRMLETGYAQRTDKLLYRDLLVFRTLSRKKLFLKTFHFIRHCRPNSSDALSIVLQRF